VIEGCYIYNFQIQSLVNFYSKFWRYLSSNIGSAKYKWSGRAERRDVAPRRRPMSLRLRTRAALGHAPPQADATPEAPRPHPDVVPYARTTAGPSAAPPVRSLANGAVVRRNPRRHPVITAGRELYLSPSFSSPLHAIPAAPDRRTALP
jgi:hypothetical protein